jgi:hypothetical protein
MGTKIVGCVLSSRQEGQDIQRRLDSGCALILARVSGDYLLSWTQKVLGLTMLK